MKKNVFLLFVISCFSFYSCNCGDGNGGGGVDCKDSSMSEHFIPVDSANKMIGSYLNSIDYEHEDSNLHSLIIDAKALNQYVQCCNPKPAKIKLMFAHTLDYINNGGGNQNAGYKHGALTLVVVPYDDSGNYIIKDGLAVMDMLEPCPSMCPSAGPASSNFIVSSSNGNRGR